MCPYRRLRLGFLIWIAACGAARAEIVINEIMYNSPGPPEVEYVEIHNTGPTAVDLTGWFLLDDDDNHDPCVLAGSLDPGEYLVIAGDLAVFGAAYPGVVNVNPNPFDDPAPGAGFGLGNGSDEVRLFDPADNLIDGVAYADSDPWPAAADGDGPSLELINPTLDNSVAESWGASTGGSPGGTPGAQNSIFDSDLPPVIGEVKRDPTLPASTDTVGVTALVTDTEGVNLVELRVDTGSGFQARAMNDDGLHGDGAAGDSVYGAIIETLPDGAVVRYYIVARDSNFQATFYPSGAPGQYLAYTVGHTLPPLEISEILASNQSGIFDEVGEREDWLEIRNRGPQSVELGGMFLTDDLGQPRMWAFPATELGPGQRLVVWCDEEPGDGALHAGFKLSKAGGEVGLFDTMDHGNLTIHELTFGPQTEDLSFGYLPDDSDAPEYLATPTPGGSNEASSLLSPICINEFLASSQIGGITDWIELYNRSDATVDLGGWFLSDDAGTPQKYEVPASTVIPAGGHLSVGQEVLGFGLAANGDEVVLLTHPNGTSGMDYFDYGPQSPDVSQGRYPDGSSNWHLFSTWTRDGSNACPVITPLGPVNGLRFTSDAAISWNPLAGAEVFDTLRGDLVGLRLAGGDYAAAALGCLENNGGDRTSFDPEEPLAGQGFFYLVRGCTRACRFGTHDSGGPGQTAGRDAGISAAPGSCP